MVLKCIGWNNFSKSGTTWEGLHTPNYARSWEDLYDLYFMQFRNWDSWASSGPTKLLLGNVH
jgi:hypothetical protein